MTQQYTYRVAVPADRAGILKVFEEVAPEVPTTVYPDTEGKLEGCIAMGLSWVAVDAAGTIAGYALVEKSSDAISLVYVGTAKKSRRQGINSTLISKLQEAGAPIVTDVRSNNASGMVKLFEKRGFVKCDPDAFSKERTKLRWEQKSSPP